MPRPGGHRAAAPGVRWRIIMIVRITATATAALGSVRAVRVPVVDVPIATPLTPEQRAAGAAKAVLANAAAKTAAAPGAEKLGYPGGQQAASGPAGGTASLPATEAAATAATTARAVVLGGATARPPVAGVGPSTTGGDAATPAGVGSLSVLGATTAATGSATASTPATTGSGGSGSLSSREKFEPVPAQVLFRHPYAPEEVLDEHLAMPAQPDIVAAADKAQQQLRADAAGAVGGVARGSLFSPGSGSGSRSSGVAAGTSASTTAATAGTAAALEGLKKIGPASASAIWERALQGRVLEPKEQTPPTSLPSAARAEHEEARKQLASMRKTFNRLFRVRGPGSGAAVRAGWRDTLSGAATTTELQPLPKLSIAAADAFPLLAETDAGLAESKLANDERTWTMQGAAARGLVEPGTAPGSAGSVAPTAETLAAEQPAVGSAAADDEIAGEGGASTDEEEEESTAVASSWDKQRLGQWVDDFARSAVALAAASIRPHVEKNVETMVQRELEKAFPPSEAVIPTAAASAGSVGAMTSVGSGGSSFSGSAQQGFSGTTVAGSVAGSGSGSGGRGSPAGGSAPPVAVAKNVAPAATLPAQACPPADVPTVIVREVAERDGSVPPVDILAYRNLTQADLFPVGTAGAGGSGIGP